MRLLFTAFYIFVGTMAAADAPQNVYAGGVSYNQGASPQIAGTGLYARAVSDSGTYAITIVDVLPTTVRPFVVTTQFSAGFAQRVATLGSISIYTPTAAGISYNGENTGWAWSTGALASIPVKDRWRAMPNVRVSKSSVSNGSGYQLIVGVLGAWAR